MLFENYDRHLHYKLAFHVSRTFHEIAGLGRMALVAHTTITATQNDQKSANKTVSCLESPSLSINGITNGNNTTGFTDVNDKMSKTKLKTV